MLVKLEKILTWGLIGVLIFPLLYNKSFLFPYITVKAYFFYIAVDLLFVLYLYLLSKKTLWPTHNRLLYLFLIFVGLKFVIDIFGLRFLTSFWGNYERMMGLYTWLHLLAYAWMLLSVFKTRQDFYKVLDFSLGVSFLVSVYGLLQKLNIDFWLVLKSQDPRIYATIGNPALLAGYLLFHLYFGAYLFTQKTDYRWRIFYALVFIANLTTLFFTATRGALLALAFSGLFMLVYVLLFYKNKQARIFSGVSLLVIILFGWSIFYFKDSSFIKNNLTLSRISNISLVDSSTKSRLLLWGSAFRASQDHWFLGVGDNHIRVALDRHYNGNLDEPWFDSSHNQFLDELLAHGWVGLLFYLFFIGFIFKTIFKYRAEDFWFSVIFSGLFLAYLVQNLFLFDTITVIVFFLLFLVFVLLGEKGETKNFILPPKVFFISAVVILLVVALIYSRGMGVMLKMVTAQKAMENNFDNSLEVLSTVGEKVFFGSDNLSALLSSNAVLIFNNAKSFRPDQLEKLMSVVNDFYKKAMVETVDFSYFYLNLAKIFQSGRSVSAVYLDTAMTLSERAGELSPNRIDVYFVRAQGFYFKENYDQAEEVLRESLKLGVKEAEVYYKLAEVQFRKGDAESGLVSLATAEQLGRPIYLENWENFAWILVGNEDWENLLKIFLIMDKIQPNDLDITYNILITYQKLGDKAKIAEWQAKVNSLE